MIEKLYKVKRKYKRLRKIILLKRKVLQDINKKTKQEGEIKKQAGGRVRGSRRAEQKVEDLLKSRSMFREVAKEEEKIHLG